MCDHRTGISLDALCHRSLPRCCDFVPPQLGEVRETTKTIFRSIGSFDFVLRSPVLFYKHLFLFHTSVLWSNYYHLCYSPLRRNLILAKKKRWSFGLEFLSGIECFPKCQSCCRKYSLLKRTKSNPNPFTSNAMPDENSYQKVKKLVRHSFQVLSQVHKAFFFFSFQNTWVKPSSCWVVFGLQQASWIYGGSYLRCGLGSVWHNFFFFFFWGP